MRVLLALTLLAGCFAADTPGPEAVPEPTAPLPPGQFVVLDASHSVIAGRQCSRDAPEIEAGWALSEADAEAVERRLTELADVPPEEPTVVVPAETRMPDLEGSVRQYVGAVVDGRNVIYINAFPASMMDYDEAFDTSRPVLACDGGADFWGVVFDPETGQFSGLAFNGAV